MNVSSRSRTGAALVGAGLMLVTLACLCGPIQQIQQIQTTVGAAQSTLGPALTEFNQNAPTFEAQATELQLTLTAMGPDGLGSLGDLTTAMPGVGGGSQWATSAVASSQYGDPEWSASQATGAPNTLECGDNNTAWASQGSNTQETLTLKYPSAVIPSSIVIYHTYNPSSVVKVEIASPNGGALTVYQGSPKQIAECPYIQTIDINLGSVTSPVDTVIITLDQSVIGNWDEIDAVQLVGAGQ